MLVKSKLLPNTAKDTYDSALEFGWIQTMLTISDIYEKKKKKKKSSMRFWTQPLAKWINLSSYVLEQP